MGNIFIFTICLLILALTYVTGCAYAHVNDCSAVLRVIDLQKKRMNIRVTESENPKDYWFNEEFFWCLYALDQEGYGGKSIHKEESKNGD